MVETKNKKIENISLSFIPFDSPDIPSFIEKVSSGKEQVSWGDNNKLPDYLWNLYLKSSLLASIINGTIDYISGAETSLNPVLSRFNEQINNEGDTLSDVVRKLATDYMIFGGFALQIINNKEGDLNEIYWIDIRKIRVDSELKYAYYSDKWGGYGTNKAIKYPIWTPDTKAKSSIYYFKGHLSRGVYPIPRYCGALPSIETSIEIGRFHLNNIKNNLEPSAVISFTDGTPTKVEQEKIERKIENKFAGASNAGKFLLTFSDSKDKTPIITRLGEDNMDKKFEILQKSTMQNIFIAFRATPELFGLSTEGNGFSKEEYIQAFELYNKTVVLPAQNDIQRAFDKIFNLKDSITINKFVVYDDKITETENE